MYGTNGLWQWLKQTLTPANWKRSASRGWTKLQELPWGELLFYGAMLSVLVWLLTGCATPSTPSDVTPRNPEPPPTTLSEHSQTYSEAARLNIEAWQKKLIELLPK
jgi:hypothetical protein